MGRCETEARRALGKAGLNHQMGLHEMQVLAIDRGFVQVGDGSAIGRSDRDPVCLHMIGMAVDANVIIFERIKEELTVGNSIGAAIKEGFSKALVAIIDANITTLIAAIVLFWLGTGSIKGFALTLSIGILVSMFTAVFVTKLFLELMPGKTKVLFNIKQEPQ